MVSGEGRVQKTGASWRKGVAGSWIIDGNMSLDAELLDIPGVVMEKPGAVIDWSCHSLMSLRYAIAHSSGVLGGFAAPVYRRRWCGGKASSCMN